MYWYRDRWRKSPEARYFVDIELILREKRAEELTLLSRSDAVGFYPVTLSVRDYML
jgi:hypothetical protein